MAPDFGSIYEQVAATIRTDILSGKLLEGDKLPAIRVLAKNLGLSRITVHKSYQLLADEGFVVGQLGSGTSVAPLQMREASKNYLSQFTEFGPMVNFEQTCSQSKIISFATIMPDLRSVDLSSYFLSQLEISESDVWSQYLPSWAGEIPLIDASVRWFEVLGVPCVRNQVMIRSGIGSLELFLRTELDRGDVVLVDDPGLLYGEAALKHFGLTRIGFCACRESPELLAKRLEINNVSGVVISPHYGSGAGVGWSQKHMRVLVDYAKKSDTAIFINCTLGLFNYSGHVIQYPCLSKIDIWAEIVYAGLTAPAFSPVAVCLPESQIDVVNRPFIGNGGLPRVSQLAAAKYIDENLDHHLRKVRTEYARKGNFLYQSLRSYLDPEINVVRPDGGVGLLIEMPSEFDAVSLFKEALSNNVAIMPGEFICANRENWRLLRFAFGNVIPSDLSVGAERAAAVINKAVRA